MDLLPYPFAKDHQVLLDPTPEQEGVILGPGYVWTALSEVVRLYPQIQRFKKCDTIADFEERLRCIYQDFQSQAIDLQSVDANVQQLLNELPSTEDLLDKQDSVPVIRTMNAILFQAIKEGVSEIHIEPYQEHAAIRFRLDGVMTTVASPSRVVHMALVSRLKVMAHLDISERRLPQDGRVSVKLAGKQLDVRLSVVPTLYGERVVLRVLDHSQYILSLESLGLHRDAVHTLMRVLHAPHGILLVTGPTGAGKTTTLYALLRCLDVSKSNIMTVEDPVEYDIVGVSQTAVKSSIGMTFAHALRALLRQDPDVIMIGEVRDHETASIAVQASLTGHLVLATLHTNSAVSAVMRLMDMGVPAFLLAACLRGVVAQRLLRRLCDSCKACAEQSSVYHAVGCQQCRYTGYRGRVGIFELFMITEAVRTLVHEQVSEQVLYQHAVQEGLCGLREQALSLVQQGITSLEEVMRVWQDEEHADFLLQSDGSST